MDYNMSYTWIGGNDYIITDQYTPGYDNTQEGYAAFRASTVLQSGALVINEICASSITTLKDEDGDYPDWIEIHNTTNQAIDLSNYKLPVMKMESIEKEMTARLELFNEKKLVPGLLVNMLG